MTRNWLIRILMHSRRQSGLRVLNHNLNEILLLFLSFSCSMYLSAKEIVFGGVQVIIILWLLPTMPAVSICCANSNNTKTLNIVISKTVPAVSGRTKSVSIHTRLYESPSIRHGTYLLILFNQLVFKMTRTKIVLCNYVLPFWFSRNCLR